MIDLEKMIDSLSKKSKEKICKKLEIDCYFMELAKKMDKIPIGFLYLLFRESKKKVNYNFLLEKGEWSLTHKLTLDEDNWGARRTHKRYLGIFEEKNFSKDTKLELEMALKSTLLMDYEEKCLFVKAVKSMNERQLMKFLISVKREMRDIERRLIYGKVNPYINNKELIKKIEENKKIWGRVVKCAKSKKVSMETDEEGVLYPIALEKYLKEFVKGQDEAVRDISTILYYQTKIHRFIKNKKIPPIDRLRPILISGETGSGKTYIISKACEIMDIPYLHINASAMVSTGIRGISIGEIAKLLLRKYDYDVDYVKGGVIILDEVDKLLDNSHYGRSVINQLLRVIEGEDIFIDKDSQKESFEFSDINFLSSKHMLFVLVGSFQFFKEEKKSGFITTLKDYKENYRDIIENSGLPKELIGRIGEIIILNSLKEEDLLEILLNSKDSPLRKYENMLKLNEISVDIKEEDLKNIVKMAAKSPYGARALEKLIWDYFKDKLFFVHKGDINKSFYDLFIERFK